MPKRDLVFTTPYMNAAGFLGFAPDSHLPVDLSRLGAFVTNPLSQRPRAPSHERACLSYPGGFLLHTGHPNPGLKAGLRRYAPRWARSPSPVIVHLLAGDSAGVAQAARRLETVEGVMALELGFPPGVAVATATAMLGAAVGELPVITQLPLERAGELFRPLVDAGASGVSLGPSRGALVLPGGRTLSGRLYGRSVFPLALAVLRQLSSVDLASPVPLIASGGIYSWSAAQALLDHGASAVQLDGWLWVGMQEG
jgi:dihydroorotate dehydrogenase (NAD+) catalytic subunit